MGGGLEQCPCRGRAREALAQTAPVGRQEAQDGWYLVLVPRNGSHRKGHLQRCTDPRWLLGQSCYQRHKGNTG